MKKRKKNKRPWLPTVGSVKAGAVSMVCTVTSQLTQNVLKIKKKTKVKKKRKKKLNVRKSNLWELLPPN